jgi:hypothetical protein
LEHCFIGSTSVASIDPFDSLIAPCFIVDPLVADPFITLLLAVGSQVIEVLAVHSLAIVPLVFVTFMEHYLVIMAFI